MVLKENIPKEKLYELYVIKEYSILMIAELFNMSDTPIKRMLDEYGIPRRNPNEFTMLTKKRMSETRKKLIKDDIIKLPINGFKKGMTPWNKGTKGVMKAWNKGKMCPQLNGVNNGMYGKKHSIHTKENMSKFRKGKTLEEIHGDVNAFNIKQKLSNANKGKKRPYVSKSLRQRHALGIAQGFKKGKAHLYFNNWSSREPYGKDFSPKLKEGVRNFYHNRCQQCFIHQEELGYRLGIHHIDFNKQNNKFDNLIPLCKTCHAQTNFNRQDWTDYFQEKLKGAF